MEPQTIETCEKFIYDVMNAMGMEDVKVTSAVDEEGALSINMEGSNMGILIGKRGQTLDSLQYLTNRVANKMQDGYVRVKLDTEDYRRRRKETLENLAKNIASKVKRTRRTVALGLSAVMAVFRTVRLRKFQFQHNSRYKGGKQMHPQKAPQSRSYFTGGDPFAENMGPEQV